MIEVKKVSKSFKKNINKNEIMEFYADKEVSFVANDGEVLGLLGPNGAGKTTLLRIMAGIMEATNGDVYYDENNFKNNEINIKKNLAFLSGNTKLYKDMSPYELLIMCGEYYEVDPNILNKRIDEIIKRFDMNSFLHQKIGNLSTGQTQRVGIARCLVHDPKYYIFDEATSGLDIISSQVILDFILEEKKRGKCIIYSTHYMEEAQNICDNVVLLHKGEVLKIGTPKHVMENTKTNNLRNAFLSLIGGEISE